RDEIKRIGLDGIYVTSIYRNSAIEGTQMDPGFIITRVNGQRVNSVEEVVSELYDARGEVTLDGIYEKFEGEYAYVFYK
ncbi:MAG: PDZ domain-containing protein, partial [Saprospiraceae bacterium]|nr:PDZ domain-containing protein [Saprospiraceae bacterium]